MVCVQNLATKPCCAGSTSTSSHLKADSLEPVVLSNHSYWRITAFYEKVKKVKADVAAVLVWTQRPPAEVLNSVKGVRQDVHLDP